MGIAEDMGRIAEDIITSYDVRVKALGDLVVDTRKTLKGFARDRKNMASEQAKSLADFVKNLTKNVGDMLKGFQKGHKEMSQEQAKALADFVTNLAKDVGSMLSGFQKDRGEMSEELKDKLAKDVKEIETYVKKRLREFDEAHTEMSDALKKSLSRYVGDIVSGVKKLLGEYSSDMAKARRAWEGMSSALAKARKTGVIPRVEAKVKVRPVKEAKPKKRLPRLIGKQRNILTVVTENPDGITLPEIAYAMGVPFVTLARDAKKLMDLKQIKKRENRYYPA